MSGTFTQNFANAFSLIRDQSSREEQIDLSRFLHSVCSDWPLIRNQYSYEEEIEATGDRMDTDALPFIRKAALQDPNEQKQSDGHQQTVEETLWNQMLQIWDEVGESDGKPYEMFRQINQECLEIYKRKVDEAAAKSKALLPQNAFWGNTTCKTLMKRLEAIWHEDGVGEDKRNEMLHQIDQECLEIYKRKAGEALNVRELLHLELANAKLELFKLASPLGLENIPFKLTGNINKQLEAVRWNQEHLLLLKDKRKVVFADARTQILKLREGIAGNSKLTEQAEAPAVSEDDLSLKKLAELRCEILGLQEKAALQDSEEVAQSRQKLSDAQQTELAAVAFRADTTCATLLKQLHQIWDEVGEYDCIRKEILRHIKQECLDIYTKNVDQAAKSRVHLSQHGVGEEDDKHNDMLHQIDREHLGVYEKEVDEAAKSSALLRKELANAKLELSSLASDLGMKTIPDKSTGTIKHQLASIHLKLKQLAALKNERKVLFADVQSQIQKIRAEIAEQAPEAPTVNKNNLSLNKLDELRSELQVLQEKSDCFKVSKILASITTVRDLCPVLGINFVNFIHEVSPRLTKSINNGTFSELAKTVELLKREELERTSSKLAQTVEFLQKEKMERLRMVRHLAAQLFELWGLIDASPEERSVFDHVTCFISATVDEVTLPRALDLAWIEDAKREVRRLEEKVSSTKEHSDDDCSEIIRLKFLKAHDFVSAIKDLCSVLGMYLFNITDEVYPNFVNIMGLQPEIIDDEILSKLAKTVEDLKQENMQRLEKLQELAGQLYDLWNLMDTSPEERSSFQHVTCNISATVDEVTQPEALALSCINHAKAEVERLELLKAFKVMEIPSKTYPEAGRGENRTPVMPDQMTRAKRRS